MASWTLWQPLIPRYQLTTKEVAIEEVNPNPRPKTSPGSPRIQQSPRIKSAKGPPSPRRKLDKTDKQRNGIGNAHKTANDEQHVGLQRGKATMYFTMASPIGSKHADNRGVVMKPSFPVRRSPYIDTLKQQQRINSARQSTEDPSTASPRHKPSSPRYKKQTTVSQFPVTQIDHQAMSNHYTNHSQDQENLRPKTAASRTTPRQETAIPEGNKRLSCKSAGTFRDAKNLSVNTIDISDDSPRLFLKNPLYKDPSSPRRYAVRKLDDATMFIDDDKIIFIKKKTTKNDVLLSQTCTEENNYIKHLRRLYLREPKDIGKLVKEPERKKGNVIRERLEYELKTDHILNYYSRVDDRQDATLWAMAVEQSRKTQHTPLTTPRSAHGFKRTESGRKRQSQNSSPPRSARNADKEKERPLSARSLPYSNISSENLHMNHDPLSDWNVFLKLNTRSILHERQFYLQTPAVSANNLNEKGNSNHSEEPACDNHECRLCRLEREMAEKRDTNTNKEEEQNIKKNSGEMVNKVYIQTGAHINREVIDISKEIKDKISEGDKQTNNGDDGKFQETKPEVCTVSTSTSDLEVAENGKSMDSVDRTEKQSINIQNSYISNDTDIRFTTTDNNVDTHNSKTPSQSKDVSKSCTDQSMTEDAGRGQEFSNDDERGKLDTA